MKKNGKNEELQSRREFFKKAAKGALPIFGAIVLGPSLITSCSKDDDDDNLDNDPGNNSNDPDNNNNNCY